jgi:hypothetical protein
VAFRQKDVREYIIGLRALTALFLQIFENTHAPTPLHPLHLPKHST